MIENDARKYSLVAIGLCNKIQVKNIYVNNDMIASFSISQLIKILHDDFNFSYRKNCIMYCT